MTQNEVWKDLFPDLPFWSRLEWLPKTWPIGLIGLLNLMASMHFLLQTLTHKRPQHPFSSHLNPTRYWQQFKQLCRYLSSDSSDSFMEPSPISSVSPYKTTLPHLECLASGEWNFLSMPAFPPSSCTAQEDLSARTRCLVQLYRRVPLRRQR